jgi:molecular chaperone HscB
MKYFEIFDLPPKIGLDAAELQRRFHELSREHHPDYHTTRSGEEQERAVRTTALLNDAYRTLRDPVRRVEYLVRTHGFSVDGSKVPQTLLAAVFEINEQLEEVRTDREGGESAEDVLKKLDQVRQAVGVMQAEHETQLDETSRRWDALVDRGADEVERAPLLEQLADIVARSAYLRNLRREIDEEVSE